MDNNELFQNWVHSQEEDSDDEMVFRPESYDFPLIRGGRKAIDLKRNQSFIERNLSSDDKYNKSNGSWSWDNNKNALSLHNSIGFGDRKFEIVHLDPEKLVLRKTE